MTNNALILLTACALAGFILWLSRRQLVIQYKIQVPTSGGWADLKHKTSRGEFVPVLYSSQYLAEMERQELLNSYYRNRGRTVPAATPEDVCIYTSETCRALRK